MSQKLIQLINKVLSFVVIGLACYILISPILPELTYRFSGKTKISPRVEGISIPSIKVDAPVLGGSDPDVMNLGMWHRPGTGNPVNGGNMVIVGHRFLYTSGPNTFYNLPKIQKGDDIIVYWKNKKYKYKVQDTGVVSPSAYEIEAPTDTPVLTIYTCTPLWYPTQRFVVRALPVS